MRLRVEVVQLPGGAAQALGGVVEGLRAPRHGLWPAAARRLGFETPRPPPARRQRSLPLEPEVAMVFCDFNCSGRFVVSEFSEFLGD